MGIFLFADQKKKNPKKKKIQNHAPTFSKITDMAGGCCDGFG